jgi:AcrR family transcriptional regulator
MEHKDDLRVRRTKKALNEAFIKLLSEKPFEDITINELCDTAGVRRATFYKHYSDKFGFLTAYTRALRDKFDSETEEDNTTEGGEPVVQNTDGEGTEGEGTEGEGTEGEGTEGEGTEGEGTEGEGTEGEGTEGEGEQEPEVDRETLRAELQKTYDEAVATVKSNYDAFKAAVEAANDAANELVELYDYAKANIAVLDSDDVYTEDIRNQLKALVTSLEADYTALKAYIESNKALGDKVESFVTENPDLFETEENTEVEPDDTTKENVFNKYAVSVNSVVYEKFENGTVFVLNFNNYAIKVLLDGAYYTVDAYGYIIID